MTHPTRDHIRRSAALGLLASALLPFSGCKKEEPPPPPPPPSPQDTGPVTPPWEDVAGDVRLSSKVDVSSATYDSVTREQMAATFRFLDAFAMGDADRVRSMLDPLGRRVLDDLVKESRWQSETESIRAVTLRACVAAGDDVTVAFTVQKDSGQPVDLSWRGMTRGDMIVFAPFAVVEPPSNAPPEVPETPPADPNNPPGNPAPIPKGTQPGNGPGIG